MQSTIDSEVFNRRHLRSMNENIFFGSMSPVAAFQIATVFSTLLLSSFCAAQKDNGQECDCFLTNGSSAAYFSYHRFFDYRNIPSSLTSAPPVITDEIDTKNAEATSPYFTDSSWTKDWAAQTWDNSDQLNTSDSDATILMINSQNNVYIGMLWRNFI